MTSPVRASDVKPEKRKPGRPKKAPDAVVSDKLASLVAVERHYAPMLARLKRVSEGS